MSGETAAPTRTWGGARSDVDGLVIAQVDTPAAPGQAGDASWQQLVENIRGGRRCVVVDAGTRPELLRLLPGVIETVMVVGLGVDDRRHVSAVVAGLPTSPSPTVGVVTRRPWYRTLPGFRNHDRG